MIWATTTDVRDYLGERLPADFGEIALGRYVTKAVNAIERIIVRWPLVDATTDRALDSDVREQLVAAVAETIAARRKNEAVEESLGGLAPILAAGGSISTKTLSASTGTSSAGNTGAPLGDRAPRVPLDALEALQAAGLIGGSVRTW